jgi:hypothetical protein
MDEEISLCKEVLTSICRSYVVDKDKKLRDSKTFLTIGRYLDCHELHASIDLAAREFQEFNSLPFESICIFFKKNGIWYREADLVTFKKPKTTFLHSSSVPL